MKVYAMERVLDSGNDMGDEKLCYEDIEAFVFAEEAIANGLVWDVETFALILKSGNDKFSRNLCFRIMNEDDIKNDYEKFYAEKQEVLKAI